VLRIGLSCLVAMFLGLFKTGFCILGVKLGRSEGLKIL
jgi:hypothetical protein